MFKFVLPLAVLLFVGQPQALTLREQADPVLPGTWFRVTAENTASDVDPAKDPALNCAVKLNKHRNNP